MFLQLHYRSICSCRDRDRFRLGCNASYSHPLIWRKDWRGASDPILWCLFLGPVRLPWLSILILPSTQGLLRHSILILCVRIWCRWKASWEGLTASVSCQRRTSCISWSYWRPSWFWPASTLPDLWWDWQYRWYLLTGWNSANYECGSIHSGSCSSRASLACDIREVLLSRRSS